MNSELAKALIETLRFLSPPITWSAAAVTGILLFCPSRFLAVFSVERLAANNREIIGLVFLSSTCLSIALSPVFAFFVDRLRSRQRRIRIERRLEKLTIGEAGVLCRFVGSQSRSSNLSTINPDVIGLTREGILISEDVEIAAKLAYPYNISEEAWEYLNKNPKALDFQAIIMRSTIGKQSSSGSKSDPPKK